VVEGISIPILMLCLSSLWQFHTGDLWYLTLTWFVLLYSVNAIMKHYAVNIYGWLMCKLTVTQRTIESKTNMQYILKIICMLQSLYTWTHIYVFSGRRNQYTNANAVFILTVTIPHWRFMIFNIDMICPFIVKRTCNTYSRLFVYCKVYIQVGRSWRGNQGIIYRFSIFTVFSNISSNWS
jgi:hypothetical protein